MLCRIADVKIFTDFKKNAYDKALPSSSLNLPKKRHHHNFFSEF